MPEPQCFDTADVEQAASARPVAAAIAESVGLISGPNPTMTKVLSLQRVVGNRAVSRIIEKRRHAIDADRFIAGDPKQAPARPEVVTVGHRLLRDAVAKRRSAITEPIAPDRPRPVPPRGVRALLRFDLPPVPAPAPPWSPYQPPPPGQAPAPTPSPTPAPTPQAPPSGSRADDPSDAGPPGGAPPARLTFFHGTAWSVASKIKQLEPRGRGDFGAGFYTHHNPAENDKARKAAVKWARRVARNAQPKDPYAGVLVFTMDDKDYRDLGRGGLARDFALTRRDQGDYDARRREWLDFITTYGREASPHYRPRGSGGEWVHEILQAPPAQPAAYNVVGGPFYRGAPGTADRQPDRVEWTPFAVGQSLPQQIVWANRGLDLLNSGSVTRDLQAYETDSDSDKPVPPPPTESVQVVIADLTAPPLAEDYE